MLAIALSTGPIAASCAASIGAETVPEGTDGPGRQNPQDASDEGPEIVDVAEDAPPHVDFLAGNISERPSGGLTFELVLTTAPPLPGFDFGPGLYYWYRGEFAIRAWNETSEDDDLISTGTIFAGMNWGADEIIGWTFSYSVRSDGAADGGVLDGTVGEDRIVLTFQKDQVAKLGVPPPEERTTQYRLTHFGLESGILVDTLEPCASVPADKAPDDGWGRDFLFSSPHGVPPSSQGPAPAEEEKAPAPAPTTVAARPAAAAPPSELEGSVVASWSPALVIGVPAIAAAAILLAVYGTPSWAATLFTRVDRDEALNHPRRALLYEYVQTNVGATFSDARRATGLGSGPFVHHLRVLERTGHIRVVRQGASTRLFPPAPRLARRPSRRGGR